MEFDFKLNVVSLCCSAVHLVNVSQALINGIQIAANVSGLLIEQCTGVLISNVVLTGNKLRMYQCGLLIYASSRILVDSLQAKNLSWGILVCKSISIVISNTQIQNCSRSGMLTSDSDSVSVVNVMSQNNKHGILLVSTNHTTIINNSLLNNVWNGITLRKAKNCDTYYTFSAGNGCMDFTLIRAQIH